MKRPTASRGKKNGETPTPPPETEPMTAEDFLDMGVEELVHHILGRVRSSNEPPAQLVAQIYTMLDALQQLISSTADPSLLTPISKLNKDLREASRTLGQVEARFLVDAYYAMQENRIRSSHQVRTLAEPKKTSTDEEKANFSPEPHDVLEWLFTQEDQLERQIRSALDYYSGSHKAGIWARSIKGVGPVIAAGLLANIDIHEARTVGHIWRFAGLDPTNKWLGTVKATELVNSVLGEPRRGRGGSEVSQDQFLEICKLTNTAPERMRLRLVDRDTSEVDMSRATVIKAVAKRPWNASLKRLCFLIGDSFVKVSNRPDALYGQLYKTRKEWETERNNRGEYADQARESLEAKRFSPSTEAYKWYSQGKLPPARIHLRAQRRAVKLFLAHLHEVMWFTEFGTMPPFPYVLENVPGHTHRLEVPNLMLVPGLEALKAKQGPRGGGSRRP